MYRDLGEPIELARTLEQLGLTLALLGRAKLAEAALQEAYALLAAAGKGRTSPRNPAPLGIVRLFAGRLQEAKSLLAEAVEGSAAGAADYWAVRALINLAYAEFCLDEVEQAVAHGRQAVALCRSQHWSSLIGQALCRLAGYLIEGGETAEAVAALREGMPLARERDNGSIFIALGMYCMAAIALGEARLERSASLFGYAEAFFVKEFGNDNPFDRRYIKRLRTGLDEAFAPEVLARLKAAGAAWSEEQAIREALVS
jgi:tetratricopeptide (TPR) repeat protein